MCEELQNGNNSRSLILNFSNNFSYNLLYIKITGSLPLLILTPNGREETGTNRDCFILNPQAKSDQHIKMFEFFGILMGIACRTGSPLSLNLAEPVWKALVIFLIV